MKKLNLQKILLILVATVFLPIKAHALLPVGIYYGIKGGINTAGSDSKLPTSEELDLKGGNPFAAANVGLKLLDFRFELEYAYRYKFNKYNNGIKEKNINAQNLMANAYYNFLELPLLKFYINGGVGNTKFSGVSGIKNEDNFTWNAGLGVNFSLIDIINLDVGYRYVDMGDLEIKNNNLKLAQKSHDIYAGLRFGF